MTTLTTDLPLLGAVIDRWLHRWTTPRARRAAVVEPDYSSLADLSDRTLRDIGAPSWVHARDAGVPAWMVDRARW